MAGHAALVPLLQPAGHRSVRTTLFHMSVIHLGPTGHLGQEFLMVMEEVQEAEHNHVGI